MKTFLRNRMTQDKLGAFELALRLHDESESLNRLKTTFLRNTVTQGQAGCIGHAEMEMRVETEMTDLNQSH